MGVGTAEEGGLSVFSQQPWEVEAISFNNRETEAGDRSIRLKAYQPVSGGTWLRTQST